jgi:site-specific DNA-cytosine methylase
MLKDILEYGEVDRDKSYCIDACYYKGGSVKQYKEKSRWQLVKLPVSFHQSEKRLMVKCVVDDLYKNRDERVYKEKSYTLRNNCGQLKVKTIAHGYIKESIDEKAKYPTLCGQDPSSKHLLSNDNETWRKLTIIECERLQTFEDGYTSAPDPIRKNKMVSNSQRYKAIGNSWTADVIAHILKYIKE